ncbi:membrane protein [Mycolicibacter heraklionensis]|uniref:Membrane protein n=1 Tax=Mycolicibacter heraklionensis TaxID=512402 RepID=A0ABR5FJ73_9MYCO|nr:membrane protein [Mycolicibacter heraklionensis]
MVEPSAVGEVARREPAPRTTRTRAFFLMAAGLTAVGPPVGALWAWVAPPIHGVVALTRSGERVQAYLGNEAEHFFIAPCLLLGLLSVVAVVSATLAWQWRAHRGPGMIASLSVGLSAGAALAVLTGTVLVHRRYGTIDVDAAPVSPDHRVHYVAEGPPVFFGHTPLQIAASLLLPAATAALVYGLCATWSTRDDLGGYPPEPVRRPQPAVTAEVGAPPRR